MKIVILWQFDYNLNFNIYTSFFRRYSFNKY